MPSSTRLENAPGLKAVTIGLVSDTHGFFDSRLRAVLSGSDVILHAGDVGSETVIDELRAIAPVHAVRGNVDFPDSGLPLSLTASFGGVNIHVLHILPADPSSLEQWAERVQHTDELPKAAGRLLGAFDSSVEVVVFGHSHSPCLISLGDVLWVNPGSAGKKRFSLPRTCGRLEIRDHRIDASIIPLEPHAGRLPERIRAERKVKAQAF